jgi:putative transcriptional regulator
MYDLKAGDCLVAPPNCTDTRFKKSVVYLWEHGEAGSAGVVINRPTNHIIKELVNGPYCPDHIGRHIMYWGGPVHTNLVFMLHSNDWRQPRSNVININMGVTSDPNMFQELGDQQPNEWRVFFGHSTWGPKQLEGELKGQGPWTPAHSWLILKEPTLDWIFNTPTETQWDHAVMACSQQTIESWL